MWNRRPAAAPGESSPSPRRRLARARRERPGAQVAPNSAAKEACRAASTANTVQALALNRSAQASPQAIAASASCASSASLGQSAQLSEAKVSRLTAIAKRIAP